MITVEDLVFGYRRDETILDVVSHRFEEGSVTAVTGASGRGKSTLLYLIGLLLTPWSGTISFDGENVGARADRRRSEFRAARIGFVFQDAALDPARTVLDNIIEVSNYTRIRRRDAVEQAEELMQRFDVGLRADYKPGEVSGGQAQRIALCRALLASPDVILADEPTGNLDARTADVVIDALAGLAHDEDKTVIIATHDATVMAACDARWAL
ncbi:MAG: ATP-binding cassette domain-containing protein [Actinobacteria bacterium]|nr:ATP-binding cassette domain-containing protein [Actinomycetota bacterium]